MHRKLDNFDHTLVRNTIHGMYKQNMAVSMRRLQKELAAKGLEVELRTLYRYVPILYILYVLSNISSIVVLMFLRFFPK